MKRTTATLLTGALTTGSALLLSVAAPGVASASGCGTTTLNESGSTAWNAPGRFSTLAGDTRATGHNEVVDGGLHVWTESNTGTDKAAALYPVANLPLADQTAESAYDLDLTAVTGGKPGYNLVLDINGPDNVAPGYVVLVKEEGFYGDLWHTSKLSDNNPATGYGVPAGGGYEGLGTIQQFSDANPDAVIQAFGYSLGSGVKGDVVITKIRFGCNDFAFDLANRAPVAHIATPVDEADASYRSFWFDGSGSTDPDGDINLSYSWNFGDGSAAQTGAQVSHVFPKGKKTYTVVLTVTDPSGLSGTDQVAVDVTPPTDTVGGPLANTGADVKGLAALGGLVAVGSAAGLVANRRRKGADA
jgi:hypothetical protein